MPAETAFGHDQTCVTRTFFGGFNHVSILTDSKESRIYLDKKKNKIEGLAEKKELKTETSK